MYLLRTRITISGFTEAEVREGLPHLRGEFRNRPWIIKPTASWNGKSGRLVVFTSYQSHDLDPDGCGRLAFDEVWDLGRVDGGDRYLIWG